MKIDILFPRLPPAADGIGDYTAQLASRLGEDADVRLLVGAGTFDPVAGAEVCTAFDLTDLRSMKHIASLVRERGTDWLIVQYNPFSYGRRGLNLALPAVLAETRRVCPRTRIATMVHEPFVRIESWQFAIMTTWQRLQLRRIGQCSDRLFFSIDAWTREFAKWFPGTPVAHSPVVSNIPQARMSASEARRRLGIDPQTFVVGLFGTYHVSRMTDRLRRAAQVAQSVCSDVLVLYIGRDTEMIRSAVAPLRTIADGAVSADEVSRRLSAIDLFVTAFSDGVSTRRGSFMAGLDHGLAIVGTEGNLTDPILRRHNREAFFLSDVRSCEQFDRDVERLAGSPDLRRETGERAAALYRDSFSVDRLAGELLAALAPSRGEGILAAR